MRILTLIIILLFALTGCETTSDQEASPETDPTETQEVAEESSEEEDDQPAATDDSEAEGEQPELAEDLEPGASRHFGAPFTIEEDPVDLATVLAEISDDEDFESNTPLKVSANIYQVCQQKGCWFTLATDEVDLPVRVRMKDYGFFIARNTEGAAAVVEGTLARTTISQEMAQHYADDVAQNTGEEPEVIDGEQDTFEFTSTGIYISQPEG